ncbi:c-type cytochrome [Novispirillum sp. DQ9]|uniref:c-type cytochrome n=1 Tax=Novispirillum sp. DQ9 TaxID=3398612 RepID=UPI003C7CB50F
MRLAATAVLALVIAGPARADMAGHGGMVRDLCVTPDGGTVASAGFDYTLRTWSLPGQQAQAVFNGHDAPLAAVACVGGDRVVSADGDGRVTVWDVAAPEAPPLADHPQAHAGRVTDLDAHPGRGLVASAGWDGVVRLWSRDGVPAAPLRHAQPVTAVAFTADGRRLWSADAEGTLTLWRVDDGTEELRRAGAGFAITALALVPPGDGLLAAGIDGTLRLFDAATGAEIRRLEQHDGPVLQVVAAPDGRTALSAGRDGMMLRWNLETGDLIKGTYAARGPVWSLALAPGGALALTGGGDGVISAWAVDSGSRVGPEAAPADEPRPWLASDHPGARHFTKCAACHSLRPDGGGRSGPHFAGLMGRPAGAVAGYPYSRALKDSGVVWTRDTIAALFRHGPDAFLPGTRMPLQTLADERDLRDLADYVAEITGPAAGR